MTLSCKVKHINIDAGEYAVILNSEDAKKMILRSQDRVRVSASNKAITGIVRITDIMLEEGEVGLLDRMFKDLGVPEGDPVQILHTERPQSVEFIKKKMDGKELTGDEIRAVVTDIVDRNLSDIELSAYVTANYINPMCLREIKDLTMAMMDTGDTIEIDKKPVFDYHSIGGVPGSKVTLLIVPIVTALGLTMPKTSSRAISSACGTADIFEVLCNVSLSIEQIKRITEDIGGVIAWGGGVHLAPADDIIIRAEYPLSIDPYSQVIASVMAKKKAVGAEFFVLDIPIGPKTKVHDYELGRKYARDFIELGSLLDMRVECALTYGGQPIGQTIGPALECKEALEVLEGKETGSSSLIEKSLGLAGILMELSGVPQGQGRALAKKALEDGSALKKMLQIIHAQGGDGEITSDKVKIGELAFDVLSKHNGYINEIDNKLIVKIARAAGSPNSKGAGIVLHKKLGDKVEVGEVLFTVYADVESKHDLAKQAVQRYFPISVEGMVLERIPGSKEM